MLCDNRALSSPTAIPPFDIGDYNKTRTGLINGFGKGTASAVPLPANKNAGFSP